MMEALYIFLVLKGGGQTEASMKWKFYSSNMKMEV